ncbi:MAG TPA: type II toxin-antitoxin system RelE/ParE family toxin [Rhodanobacteraceae bacterium]
MAEVREYQTRNGRRPLSEWIDALRDQSARVRVLARIDRLRVGLRGDWKSVGSGVFELRLDHGPGYRIYCAEDGDQLVILLCGGDKRRQRRDIETAHEYWTDYQERSERTLPRR